MNTRDSPLLIHDIRAKFGGECVECTGCTSYSELGHCVSHRGSLGDVLRGMWRVGVTGGHGTLIIPSANKVYYKVSQASFCLKGKIKIKQE